MRPHVYEPPSNKHGVVGDGGAAVPKKGGPTPPLVQGPPTPGARAVSSKTASLEALPPGGVMVSNILAEYLGIAIQKNMDPDKAFDMAMDKIKKYTSY